GRDRLFIPPAKQCVARARSEVGACGDQVEQRLLAVGHLLGADTARLIGPHAIVRVLAEARACVVLPTRAVAVRAIEDVPRSGPTERRGITSSSRASCQRTRPRRRHWVCWTTPSSVAVTP